MLGTVVPNLGRTWLPMAGPTVQSVYPPRKSSSKKGAEASENSQTLGNRRMSKDASENSQAMGNRRMPKGLRLLEQIKHVQVRGTGTCISNTRT